MIIRASSLTRRRLLIASVALFALAASLSSEAQVERSGGGETQRIMQQYQQVAAEKTQLQAQVDQMKKDLETAQATLASTKKERDALKVRAGAAAAQAGAVAALTASKEAAEKNVGAYKQRMEELIGKYREIASNLRDVEADRGKLRQQLEERNASFDKCAGDNLQLYQITNEVLDRYEHVGLFTKVSAADPFTRITRTRIENLVDEYRQRALENRIKQQTPATPRNN
jgi:chromosome segregation ATPase